MGRNRAKLQPHNIRFSHDDISSHFRDDTSINTTFKQLKSGKKTVNDIPKIKIVKRGDHFFTVNNRRLWVFRKYEKFLQRRGETLRVPILYGVHGDLLDSKLTTRDEGLTVKVRNPKMPEYLVCVRASFIRYTSAEIYFRGSNEGSLKKSTLSDILEKLENGSFTTDNLPRITVVQRGVNYYTVQNERILWAVKEYAEKHKEDLELTCNLGKLCDLAPVFKTTNGGKSVRVLAGYPKKKSTKKRLNYDDYDDDYDDYDDDDDDYDDYDDDDQ